jgi:hypothetical protein
MQQTLGIAAAELLEEIRQKKQLWVDAWLRIGEQMDRFVVSCGHSKTYFLGRRHALWLSTVLICFSLTVPAQTITQPENTSAPFSTRAIHLPGVREREE